MSYLIRACTRTCVLPGRNTNSASLSLLNLNLRGGRGGMPVVHVAPIPSELGCKCMDRGYCIYSRPYNMSFLTKFLDLAVRVSTRF